MGLLNRIRLYTGIVVLAVTTPVPAQLPAPNASGVSTGHTHLNVPNLGRHREIWKLFGAEVKYSGTREVLQFPDMYLLLTEREPSTVSASTGANHIGFSVQSYALYRAKLEAVGASFIYDNADEGQILADLPDGVRVEFQQVDDQAEPIRFHHTHLFTSRPGELRDWYAEVFGAGSGERRGLPAALIPGGELDFFGVESDPQPTQGSAIDHIGFEVRDMDAFAEKMQRLGIEFNRAPSRIDAINLTIAFITDPAGTYIEITEGLDEVE